MRRIASHCLLIIGSLLLATGCSPATRITPNPNAPYVTLLDKQANAPMLAYLQSQGAACTPERHGRVKIHNTPATQIALNRWLIIQRLQLEAVALNLANQHTLSDAEGNDTLFVRRIVVRDDEHIAHIVPDEPSFRLVFEPNHKFADRDGYVRYPDISPAIEQIQARKAQQQYNLTQTILQRFDNSIVTTPRCACGNKDE